jgi:hypothetical protein
MVIRSYVLVFLGHSTRFLVFSNDRSASIVHFLYIFHVPTDIDTFALLDRGAIRPEPDDRNWRAALNVDVHVTPFFLNYRVRSITDTGPPG